MKEEDELSSMITPIATYKKVGMTFPTSQFRLKEESSESTECKMASMTNQFGISTEAYTELVSHHVESFMLIEAC